jgi:hypothetical protein
LNIKKIQRQIALLRLNHRANGGDMKTALCSILAILIVAAIQVPSDAVQTDSLYCDGQIVSVGDTAGEVISKCGQPAYVFQHEQKIVEEDYAASRIITTNIIDDWTFNFGPDRFQYRVLLKNGRVSEIESLDYGY